MDDPTVNTDEEPQIPRPRYLTAASLSTALLGLFHAHSAENTLQLVNEAALSTPGSPAEAMRVALWRAAQAHRAVVIGHESATLVLAVTLVLGSVRVLLGVKGAGWLWRQALIGNTLLGVGTVFVDRALYTARTAAMRQVIQSAGSAVQLPPDFPTDAVFQLYGTLSWFVVFVMLASLFLSTREEARAALD
ncbi:MAG: hypothetical protein JNK72_06920 [Myxococcales bacterium]|nr:hypothetical protein [Myxococcales bacterium]